MIGLSYLGISLPKGEAAEAVISGLTWSAETGTIYSSSGGFGWLTSWYWNGASFDETSQVALSGGDVSLGSAELVSVSFDSADLLFAAGGAVNGVAVYETVNGQISELTGFGTQLDEVSNITWLEGQGDFTFVTTSDEGEALRLWTMSQSQGAQLVDEIILDSDSTSGAIAGTAQFQQHGITYVAAIDQVDNSISLLSVSDSGFETLAQFGNADGLPVSLPSNLEAVEFNGQTFLIIGGSGSNSISVLLAENGTMQLRDQVIDDRVTRFDGIGVLETIEFEGRVYIAASGQDSGVSIFTLLPDGRLLSLGTLEDQVAAPLDDITALEFGVQDGDLRLFVAGEGWSGISVLDLDTGLAGVVDVAADEGGVLLGGSANDLLSGGGGDDQIMAGSGDDVLVDGAGIDTLTGGEGADVFVFDPDGEVDQITDFDISEDRINLSFWNFLYSASALEFSALEGGVQISFRDETLNVFTVDGVHLSESDFSDALLFDGSHIQFNPPQYGEEEPPVDPVEEPPVDPVEEPPVDPVEEPPVDPVEEPPVDPVEEPPVDPEEELDLSKGDHNTGTSGNDVLVPEQTDAVFDFHAAVVTRLFQAVLGRSPNLEGHAGWTGRLIDQSLDGAGLAEMLMGSAEFEFVYGNTGDVDFITLLYENVLGRAPAEAGLAAWVGHLENGMTREEVVLSFSGTPEFIGLMQNTTLSFSLAAHQAAWVDDVYRLFQTTLGREPIEEGLLWWSENLAKGVPFLSAIQGFVEGPEFQSRYGATSNLEFANLLFQNVLGRDPQEAGLLYWTERLDEGMSRSEVVAFFAQSNEFVSTSHDGFVAFMRELAPDDVIVGLSGNDTLQGGALSDVFVFDLEDTGHNTIIDFEEWDYILLSNIEQAELIDVFGSISVSGDNLVLSYEDTSIMFLNLSLDDIALENFLI